MDLLLKGKNCIINGGSRGIGRAIALGLAAEGANVAICARKAETLGQTEAEIREKGVNVFAKVCDIGEPQALKTFLFDAYQELGTVDIFVQNASALALGSDLDSWEANLRIDLMAAVHSCEQVVPWMRETGGGSILFVSSISGYEATPLSDFGYTTVKAALIAYAKKLAVLEAPNGIRVNALAPGSIEFPGGIWANVKENQPQLYEMVHASIPSGRLGTPEEVADAALYLVSQRATWVTGITLVVDGGQHRGIH